ncbi:MAG: aspartyl-tRNA amidotransferase [Dehalococcoidaceae bacterium]|nr:aspartyl-tRNA amidotransferase [Dehalococcoidaceae bacterium]
MSILEQVKDDLKQAMKSGDSVSRDTLRMMISEVNNAKISLGHEPSEDEIISVFKKESKKRREAIVEFEKAKRSDLADKEKNELKVIEQFLPEELSDEAVRSIIEEMFDSGLNKDIAEFGKIMKDLMPKINGQADGSRVSAILREYLSE